VSAAHAFLLLFLIYRADDNHAWEQGTIAARSCAAAEAFIRAGLRPGQAVQFGECRPVTAGVVAR
jgi:hypothetical protein